MDGSSLDFWNKLAGEWDQSNDDMFKLGPRAEALRFFCQIAGQPPQRVLDFGCGPGGATARLAEMGYETVGVDQSPPMVEAVKRRGVEAVVSDGDPLPFADGHFDAVFACTSLEWVPEAHRLVKELVRVTRPGGAIVSVCPGPWLRPRWSAYERHYGRPVPHNMLMPWELHRLLTDHGLTVQGMQGHYMKDVAPATVESLSSNWVLQASVAALWSIGCTKE